MGLRIVPELDHEWMTLERRLHDAALHAPAPSVDEANLAKTRGLRRVDVLLDHRRDVPGMECMEIEFGLDRNPDWVRGRLVVRHETSVVDRCQRAPPAR